MSIDKYPDLTIIIILFPAQPINCQWLGFLVKMSVKTAAIKSDQFTLFFSQLQDFNEGARNFRDRIKNPIKGIKLPKLSGIKKKYIIFTAVAIVILAGLGFYFFKSSSPSDSAAQIQTESGVSTPINKKLEINIKSSSGEDTGNKLIVNFISAERTEKILYKGRPLLPREGKDFLVINIEIENSTKDRLNVRPADFIRLVDATGRQFAPDIQTDVIKVEPLSIKRTRTVYIVPDGTANIKFLLGEIKGDRETVEVKI